jgi:phospholipid/cholesterol/gamma-HCH transport system ATP-binding protein
MIQIVDLYKQFDSGPMISNGVNLEIPYGKMTVIVGRSGEGKSVLLKQLIGLIEPTSGSIIIDGVNIIGLPPLQREKVFQKFGYVFQFAALLDSLTIFQNIGITFLEQGMSERAVAPVVKEKLRMVNLEETVLAKYPSELSGGMRKRVGLARTLVSKPEIILYDEPTTGLDPITTRVIHELMFDMQKKLNITSIVISHDVEIFKYADRVALLHQGKIRYCGDAKTVWDSDNPYIYQFIRGLTEGPMAVDAPVKAD